MRILEQDRIKLTVQFGRPVVPMLLVVACIVIGIVLFAVGTAMSLYGLYLLGVLAFVAAILPASRATSVTVTIDRHDRSLTYHPNFSWKSGGVYPLSELRAIEARCDGTRCRLVADFISGPDFVLWPRLSVAEAQQLNQLIQLYLQ